jgi:hypothetical protein
MVLSMKGVVGGNGTRGNNPNGIIGNSDNDNSANGSIGASIPTLSKLGAISEPSVLSVSALEGLVLLFIAV